MVASLEEVVHPTSQDEVVACVEGEFPLVVGVACVEVGLAYGGQVAILSKGVVQGVTVMGVQEVQGVSERVVREV